MNPDKWESVETIDASSGVMVSNLPLVFARGVPTSLPTMTLRELESFVPFMVRCSLGEELKTLWSQLPKPQWWPSRLPFRLPSASTEFGMKQLMLRLIERCYTFHGCQYLLQFCTSLVQMQPSVGYKFTDNRDGTTSMYHGSTGKLLVTFRNENRDYDKVVVPNASRPPQKKKTLLSSSQSSGKEKGSMMVRPPITDVFLCDRCDDEFSSMKEVQIHEKQCRGTRSPSPQIPSPEPDIPEDEEQGKTQVPFLSQFGLKPCSHTGLMEYKSPRKYQQSPIKKYIGPNMFRFDAIDLASPLGKSILHRTKLSGRIQMTQHNVMRYERHIYAAPDMDIPVTRERCANRWVVVYRASRDENKSWTHLYAFNKLQRLEKRRRILTGLDRHSRFLLSLCKKKVRIKVKRLSKRFIDRTINMHRRVDVACIDLTASEEPATMMMKVEENSKKFVPIQLPGNVTIGKIGEGGGINPLYVPARVPTLSNGIGSLSSTNAVSNNVLTKLSSMGISAFQMPINDIKKEFKNGKGRPGGVNIAKKSVKLQTKKPVPKLEVCNSEFLAVNSLPKDSSPIEIIDLSSDEEDMEDPLQDASPSTVDKPFLDKTSIERSKNGYSHWSLNESLSARCLKSCFVASGFPVGSILSTQQPTPPPSPTQITSFPVDFFFGNAKPLSRQIEELTKAKKQYEHVVVDEEISFKSHVPISILVTKSNNSSPCLNMPPQRDKTSIPPVEENNNNNVLPDTYVGRVNNGFKFLSSFVNNESLTKMTELKKLENFYDDEIKLKPTTPQNHHIKVKRRSRELYNLQKDECKELGKLGIEQLSNVSGTPNKRLTRCSLERKIDMRHTRHGKFRIYPKKMSSRLKSMNDDRDIQFKNFDLGINNNSNIMNLNVMDDKVKNVKNSSVVSDEKYSKMLVLDSKEFSHLDENGNCSSQPPLMKSLNVAFENNAFKKPKLEDDYIQKYSKCSLLATPKKIKTESRQHNFRKQRRKQLCRELASLIMDECKEIKDLGFHPSYILGSSPRTVSNASSPSSDQDSPPKRPSLPNSLLTSSKFPFKYEQNDAKPKSNKRNRELKSLMRDEWKELKSTGGHPAQILGFDSPPRRGTRSKDSIYKVVNKSSRRRMQDFVLPLPDDISWCLSRCTRAQEKGAVNEFEIERPRNVHRDLLILKPGMCVISYNLPNIC